MFTLDDPKIMLYGSEPIYRNGEYISTTTSGAYGFEVGTAIAMGYLSNLKGITDEWIKQGKYAIMVEGNLVPATVVSGSPYDPKNLRTKM